MEETAEPEVLFDDSKNAHVLLIGKVNRMIEIRWPTDSELIRRQSATKIISKDLGRGNRSTEVESDDKVSAKLFSELRVHDTDDLDPAEAVEVLERLTDVEIVNVEREGTNIRVWLNVLGSTSLLVEEVETPVSTPCRVEHLLEIPSRRDLINYGRSSISRKQGSFGRTETQIHLEVAVPLYEKMVRATAGYAEGSGIPLTHKASAVNALVAELDREASREDIDPVNFPKRAK